MKVIFILLAMLGNWYTIPSESPALPAEVEGIDLNLKSDELAITLFSLSDGEAALLQHATGENILINSGGEGTAAEIEKLLQLFDVKAISTIILTRPDFNPDTLNKIISNSHVRKVISGKSASRVNAEMVAPAVLELWDKGKETELFPGLFAEVLFEGGNPGEGLDLSLRFLKHRIFYMSSIGQEVEETLIKQPLHDVNVLKIPSYGIEGSISNRLIMHMDPQIAVIFNSKSQKPGPDLIEQLHEAWIDVYLTRKHGTVTMKFTDINYEVITIFNEDDLK